jgi:hypothetical protein
MINGVGEPGDIKVNHPVGTGAMLLARSKTGP